MSTLAIAVERKLTKYFRSPDLSLRESFNIGVRVTLHSDASRIFETLTRPEFLETWITLPGDDAHCQVVASRQPGGYRFDHYRYGRRDRVISGEYRFCRRRKMLFSWRMTGDREGSESLVYIGLYGNFSDTILELHHRGIASVADYGWQQEMWNLSLDRLSKLFGR
jgi:uncharacterized protein YndB with AHSA1/START domain